MAIRKFASVDHVQVLDLKGSPTRVRHASLGKLADFESYRTQDGYLYARIRAISSRINKNHDGWPSIELAGGKDIFDRHLSSDGFTLAADRGRDYGFSTFLGKPIFIDHHNSDPSRARGVIVDAKFHVDDHKTASLDPYYSSPHVDPEHLPGTWVELLLEVDAKAFPKFAKAIVEGSRNPKKGLDGWSMGCDVEKSVCSVCKNAASMPDEYCQHVRMKGAHFDSIDEHGHKTSKRAYENCYGVKFFEISGVFDPADETALSREVRSSVTSETNLRQMFTPVAHENDWDPTGEHFARFAKVMTQDEDEEDAVPPKKTLKGLADDVNEAYLDESGEAAEKRKKKSGLACPNCSGHGCGMCNGTGHFSAGYHDDSDLAGGAHYDGQFECPECGWSKFHQANEFANSDPTDATRICSDCGAREKQAIGGDGFSYPPLEAADATTNMGVGQYGTPRQGSVRTAENPLPQSEMSHAPDEVNTLRDEEVCPVCGSSMDEDTCDVCGFQAEPEGFGNPDLTKAKDVDLSQDGQPEIDQGQEPAQLEPTSDPTPDVNTPPNPTSLAHVTRDRTSARINKIERPVVASDTPATNEPKETIISDQLQPVTSKVRTAQDFIAAVDTNRRNKMNRTADGTSAEAVSAPDVKTEVVGVGGVDQASNDAASKADAQVDVLAIGGTGVEGVAADKEGVNVEQGDEHSKNVEAIPTKTWSGDERQHDPVSSEPFPASADGVHATSGWHVVGYDDAPFVDDEINHGKAVKGVQPHSETFGERVDVLDHVTSPANNSGETKTWSGTDGNGVTKQQDPVTNESIALGENDMEGAPNWTSSTHIFTAFKLADLEVNLGLLPEDKKYDRAAELESFSPTALVASLQYAQRVKQSSARKTAGVQKLPVMGRPTEFEKEAATETTEDDSFMFGGI